MILSGGKNNTRAYGKRLPITVAVPQRAVKGHRYCARHPEIQKLTNLMCWVVTNLLGKRNKSGNSTSLYEPSLAYTYIETINVNL